MSRITPTIGRKIYYYPDRASDISADSALTSMANHDPFDATVIYVWGDGVLVNLSVIDHVGTICARHSVPLIQEDDAIPQVGGYAKWMPYQVGQATAQAAGATLESSAASASTAAVILGVSESAPVETSKIATIETNSQVVQDGGQADQMPSTYASSFGGALAALKDGKRVAREGWNGKGMWLALSGPNGPREIAFENFWSKHNSEYARLNGGSAKVLPCITMKTATGEILMGWLASQTDMLAEDWEVVS